VCRENPYIHLHAILAQSFSQVFPHPPGIGHDGQGRIHRAAGREEAGINDIEIVHVVRFTVDVESRRLGIDPKADGAVLMRDPGQRDALVDEQIPREQPDMACMPADCTLRLLLHLGQRIVHIVETARGRPTSPEHIRCQAVTCPGHRSDVMHTAGVSGPLEVGKPAWGRMAPQGADENC
jgi:hypothetical protein